MYCAMSASPCRQGAASAYSARMVRQVYAAASARRHGCPESRHRHSPLPGLVALGPQRWLSGQHDRAREYPLPLPHSRSVGQSGDRGVGSRSFPRLVSTSNCRSRVTPVACAHASTLPPAWRLILTSTSPTRSPRWGMPASRKMYRCLHPKTRNRQPHHGLPQHGYCYSLL